MSRDRGYHRRMAIRHARRRKHLSDSIYWWYNRGQGFSYYKNLHQYSKNKIHCSCMLCSAKTRNKGGRRNKKGNYAPSLNYKISDRRKIDRMDYEENEFYNFDFSENF